MKISNLPDKIFKEMVIRILTQIENRTEKLSDNFNKRLESVRENQADQKNTITVMENTVEDINSRLANTEEWISDLEDRLMEINQ